MYNRHIYLIMRGILPLHGYKSFGTSSTLNSATHYEALGIPRSSTQNEIKSAYYKLSMQYHPDKNKGCEISAKKFREISAAYEVLGNYRLRRLYDKGVIHTVGPASARPTTVYEQPEVEDDPETKFYKSRFKKSQVSDEAGRTPIYDFDEWSRAHYGKSFQRRQEAKTKYDNKQHMKKEHALIAQNEILYFGMIFFLIGTLAIFYSESSLDTPKTRALPATAEAKANALKKYDTKISKDTSSIPTT